jgi:hypothetical protein
MPILTLLLTAVLADSMQKQAEFVPSPDTLGKERQDFYHAVSSQISPDIKARVNLKADDTLAIAWRGNDDGGTGETYIFPAGHSDRMYVTAVNPGWNAEQSVVYQSVTCFSCVKGVYAAVWTVGWRDTQGIHPPVGGTGLAKLVGFDAQHIDNKYVKDELTRVRPYAMYRKGDGDSPWYSEFYDDQLNRTASRGDDAGKFQYVFKTLVDEQDFLAHHQ